MSPHPLVADTPLGPLVLEVDEGDEGALTAARFDADATPLGQHVAIDALVRYFAGELDALDAIEVKPAGTPFQLRVWSALREIPAGRTASYGELARELGSVARAVGTANGLNPIALFVPCHRVIGADGSLTGYAGGLKRKHRLLVHEKAVLF